MVDRNEQAAEKEFSLKEIAPGINLILAIGRRVRNSIFDYSLGAAILGLIPVYGRWIPAIRIALLIVLNIKMIVNISHFWGNHKGQGNLAIIGCLLGIIGSFVLGIIAWLVIFIIGLFIPLLDSLARGIGYGVLTWNIGRAVSRYYYSPQTLDVEALAKAVQFQRSQKNKNTY